jgi:ribonuclease VapC
VAAEADLRAFLEIAGINCVAITPDDATTALAAFARFGKGRGHPAQFNLGDCFAYAVARNHGIPVLFTGEDFSQTDIARAI